MDSVGSYHMTPRRDFLFDFKEFNGGTVLLSDNRSCAIKGTEKVIKGSLMVLSGTMKGNYVYSLDGGAKSGLNELERRDVVGNKGLVSSNFMEIMFLENQPGHKNEAFNKFKKWKQLVENQTGRKLKKLRTNNGLEFCNQEFNNLCNESGIARHLTVAGTPQQNGLAKQINRTLLNKVKCLLIQSGLPDLFWAEATVTAAYLINRSPSTPLEKNTHMDLWSGHLANYEMLRIFGCVAYSHMNQGKLKPRAINPDDSGKEVEFEVYLQGSRIERTVDPHTGENPRNKDEEQDEEPQK
nr:retrovirus-related Pol polyprotein from transposon TNT 1-94 [Tanacetum cinerariifolium]